MKRSSAALALAVVAGALGFVAAVAWTSGRDGELAVRGSDAGGRLVVAEAAIEALTRRLDAESRERARLMAEVEGLRRELAALAAREGSDAAVDAAASEDRGARADAGVPVPRLDVDALAAVGFDPREVEWLRARLDEIELRRLYTRDRAAREGWLDSPRFEREQSSRIAELAGMREEVGEELYDWLLYSSGHPNRVRVSEILTASPAESAGVETGDVIVAYNNDRILRIDDLRSRSTSGVAGESVALDVRRGDEEFRLYVPRGPLGVRVQAVAREPAARR